MNSLPVSPVPVRFVHGWGFGPAVWRPVMAALPDRFRTTTISLPGYEAVPPDDGPAVLHATAERLCGAATEPSVWVGWSLGGMHVLDIAARRPELVRALVLIATNASFVARSDWPHGLDSVWLDELETRLDRDVNDTLRHFAMLTAHASQTARSTARTLRQCLRVQPQPDRETLRAGLRALREIDLRSGIGRLRCPVLMIFGADDALIPASAADAMQALNPRLRSVVIAGAGHAPFISHTAEFLAAIEEFVQQP